MIEATIFCSAIYFVLCTVLFFYRVRKFEKISLIDWSIFCLGGIYGAGWIVVISVTSQGGNPTWENWLLPHQENFLLHNLAGFIILISLLFGWKIVGKSHAADSNSPVKRVNFDWKRLNLCAWVLLIISIVCQAIYTSAYGGFIAMLEYSMAIRSASIDIENSYSFLQPFGGLALFSSYIFYGLRIDKHKKVSATFGFLLSVAFSLYIMFSLLGRMGFLMYIITLAYGKIIAAKKRPMQVAIFSTILLSIIPVLAYYLSLAFDIKGADSLLEFMARELSFPFVSFFAQLDFRANLSRLFIDFIVSPLYLLPSSWWRGWLPDLGQVNTAIVLGAEKGVAGVTGAVPVDIITLGLTQLHLIGIFFVGGAFGAMLRYLQNVTERIPNDGVRSVLTSYVTIKIAAFALFYSHPSQFVQGNFSLLLTFLAIYFFTRRVSFRFSYNGG